MAMAVVDGMRPRPEEVVASFEEGAERRVVTLRMRPDGSLEVGEVLSGPLARQVYGEATHDHRVVVAREGLEAVRAALPKAKDVPHGIRSLLGNEDTLLCDLMDLLDSAGVPYTYLCVSQHGPAFRPAC